MTPISRVCPAQLQLVSPFCALKYWIITFGDYLEQTAWRHKLITRWFCVYQSLIEVLPLWHRASLMPRKKNIKNTSISNNRPAAINTPKSTNCGLIWSWKWSPANAMFHLVYVAFAQNTLTSCFWIWSRLFENQRVHLWLLFYTNDLWAEH